MEPITAKTDLTNMTFGYWTVIGPAPSKNNRKQWLCRCKCGTERIVTGTRLRCGTSKSCGCLRKEKAIEAMKTATLKNEIGNRYGKLQVVARAPYNIDKHAAWICKCDCGNTIITSGVYLRNGGTKSCGCIKRSFGEQKIADILTDANISFIREKTFKDCISKDSNHMYRFDFYVDNKYIIEFDGPQHDKPVGWGTKDEILTSFEIIKERDKYKNEWCATHNIPLIRIPYTHLNSLCLKDLLLETSSFIIKGDKV